jgi:regulation of enolase protein 1 (concanavalin A-like superfamily)
VFRDGKRTTQLSKDLENRPAALRLERRGEKLRAAVSQDDGKSWHAFAEQDARLPEKVKVGVAAINATTEPFTATFEKFEVTPANNAREP